VDGETTGGDMAGAGIRGDRYDCLSQELGQEGSAWWITVWTIFDATMRSHVMESFISAAEFMKEAIQVLSTVPDSEGSVPLCKEEKTSRSTQVLLQLLLDPSTTRNQRLC
jgi:hypothetical protein